MRADRSFGAKPIRFGARLVIVIALTTGFAGSAAGEDGGSPGSLFDSEFSIALGGFFPYIESDLSIAASDGSSGTSISGEDVLGLDNSNNTVWIGGVWQYLPRHQLQGEWFNLDRKGQTTASEVFDIGDTTVFVGADLSTKLDLSIGRLTYGYTFYESDDVKGNFLIGTHFATAKLTVAAAGAIAIDGVPTVGGSSEVSSSTFTFPLPHFGGSVVYRFAPRWTAQFTALGFYLDIGEFEGSLIQLDASAAYQLSEHFGVGAGLKYFQLDLRTKQSSGAAEYDYRFLGPAIYGYTTF